MKGFLANVVYTTAPARSDLIPSLPKPEQQILWVGCSNSQTIETDALSIPRQELFVYRNLGTSCPPETLAVSAQLSSVLRSSRSDT
ncbi:hypothetical protein DL95DRAFT_491221 [Leptodontidium sp. 2 PMI_412]|nr:hypothetical protein DL95DRAFT_491221 [Leptodontidium sp. 2 PMI_412]